MVAGFNFLLAKISLFAEWIGKLAKKVFTSIWDLLVDFVAQMVDTFLGLVKDGISAIDVSVFDSALNGLGSLPAEFINILQLLHVGTAIGIITAAIGIRLILQLIPFVRLGS